MSEDLQLGRGAENSGPGGEGRRGMPVNSIVEQPEGVDVLLVAGGGDTALID